MAQLTDADFEAASERGLEMLEHEPRASTARFDPASRRIVVDLLNGCTFIFPVDAIQELQGADDEGLSIIEIEGMGFDLYFPALDVDLYVPALVSGIFGTKAWMEKALARRAGSAKSPAKTAAARENGKKGGRPRKVA
jgi:hypothetical protein